MPLIGRNHGKLSRSIEEGCKTMTVISPFQPTQQLYDNEGGEEDGVHFGPEVSGCRAALP